MDQALQERLDRIEQRMDTFEETLEQGKAEFLFKPSLCGREDSRVKGNHSGAGYAGDICQCRTGLRISEKETVTGENACRH